ncbi:tumor necrosis factor receptor superfamily member 4-like protein [Camelus ferus]|nr:tumor necrosis factor receptor superfamily member 4-like protein [Camelus ferus]
MALWAVTPRWPGQRALLDRTGQRGQSGLAASGPRLRLLGPRALILVILGVVLSGCPRSGDRRGSPSWESVSSGLLRALISEEWGGVAMGWPGLRALPDRTGQRRQSAPALSGAQAGRTPGLRALIFTVLGFVLLAAAALATATGQDRIHQQLAASPGSKRSFWKLCPPGEEEKSPCTATKDTECQCKPDTFRGRDSPEFCHKCSTRERAYEDKAIAKS